MPKFLLTVTRAVFLPTIQKSAEVDSKKKKFFLAAALRELALFSISLLFSRQCYRIFFFVLSDQVIDCLFLLLCAMACFHSHSPVPRWTSFNWSVLQVVAVCYLPHIPALHFYQKGPLRLFFKKKTSDTICQSPGSLIVCAQLHFSIFFHTQKKVLYHFAREVVLHNQPILKRGRVEKAVPLPPDSYQHNILASNFSKCWRQQANLASFLPNLEGKSVPVIKD